MLHGLTGALRSDKIRRFQGQVSEWLMEADCKSAGSAYGGSNPSLPTLEDWLSGLKREPAKFLRSLQVSVGSNPTSSAWVCNSVGRVAGF